MASSVELDQRIKTAEGIIDAALSGQPGNRKIYIAWDEWNVWYRARGDQERGRRILEEHYNLEDALVVATFLNTFVNHAAHRQDRQHGATGERDRAHLHQRQGPVPADHLLSRCNCSPTTRKGKALELFVDSPKYKTTRFDDVPYLDVSAGYDNGTLVLNVVNRHPRPGHRDAISNSRTSSSPARWRSPKSTAPTSNRRTISIRPR